jgi:predicted HicB family RNase H-like nuclease
MKYEMSLGGKPLTLIHDDLDTSINVDNLTKIDTSNIFGEHVTISAAVNRIGLLKAEVQKVMSEAKLDLKMYEGNFKAKLRKQAANNSGKYTMRVGNDDVAIKLTESALATSFETDAEWIKIKKAYILSERNFNALESLYWACQDKSRKLNGLVQGTTPDEYVSEMIEGKVNGILIKK